MIKKLSTTKWNLTDNTGLEYTVLFSPSTGVRKIISITAVDNDDVNKRVDVTHTMTDYFGLDATIEAIIDWDSIYAEEEPTHDDHYYHRAEHIVRHFAQSYRR